MKNKRLILIVTAVLLVFGLSSCKHIYITTLGTLKDLQGDISNIEEKLIELNTNDDNVIDEDTEDPLVYELTERGYIYQRDSLLEHLGEYEDPSISHFYDTELEEALAFIKDAKVVLEDNLDKKTSDEILKENNTYTFNVTLDGSILIHYVDGSDNLIYKVSIKSNKLYIDYISYEYDESMYDPLSGERLEYSYYTFRENSNISKLEISGDKTLLEYASMKSGTYYIIDNQDLSTADVIHSAFTVYYYDSINNAFNKYQIYDDEIISESLSVYNENGISYQYVDSNLNDESVNLKVNFLSAEGYDYLITPTFYDVNNINEGLYLNDDTQVYQGQLFFDYDESKDETTALIEFDIPYYELSNELFNLNIIGLNLESDTSNYDSFKDLHIKDIEELSNQVSIGTFDMFDNDIEHNTYSFISSDIKEIISEFYNPTKVIEPDASLLFRSDITKFFRHIHEEKHLKIDEVSLLDDLELSSVTSIDINNTYYSTISNDLLNGEKKYIVLNIENKLLEFKLDYNLRNEYRTLSSDISSEEFNNRLEDLINLRNPMLGLTSIEQLDSHSYKVSGSMDILGYMGKRLFEDKGYLNYSKSLVEATITFSEDYMSYTFEFVVTGLIDSTTNQNAVYTGTRTYLVEEVEMYNPLEDEDLDLPLAKNKDDIIYTTELSDVYGFDINEQDSRWMKLNLDLGAYKVIVADYDERLLFEVYDSEFNLLRIQQNFNVSEQGEYYIKLTSTIDQEVTLSVIEDNFDASNSEVLDINKNSALLDSTVSQNRFYIINANDQARILKLTIDEETCNCTYEDMFTLVLTPSDKYDEYNLRYILGTEIGYFYLEAGVEYYIEASSLANSISTFTYEFIDMPTEDSTTEDITVESLYDHPDIMLSFHQTQIKVHFTVSVKPLNTLMSINSFFKANHFDIKLFKENGEELLFESYLTLSPGNYYFEYSIEKDDGLIIISIELDDLT